MMLGVLIGLVEEVDTSLFFFFFFLGDLVTRIRLDSCERTGLSIVSCSDTVAVEFSRRLT